MLPRILYSHSRVGLIVHKNSKKYRFADILYLLSSFLQETVLANYIESS